MAWDDIQTAGSCFTPADWNAMVTFVKGLSCLEKSEVTFYIYSDCSNSTGQKFKFDFSGDDSLLYGGDTSGDDLLIYANDVDSLPLIALFGDSDIELCVTDGRIIYFLEGNREFFGFRSGANLSILEGGKVSGDDFLLGANSDDTYPFIKLFGDAELYLEVSNEEEILFLEGGDQFFLFDRSGTSSLLYGGADTGDSLKILANTTDTYPFMIFEGDDYVEIRTTNDIYFFEQAAQMFKFSLSGPTSIIYGGAGAGDDLFIYPNTVDSCSIIKLWGDSGIDVLIKAGSIFDISTCSAEKLFEVNSGAGNKYVDFHCLDAHNFVLELRTTDPSSPTCMGQIWFRTDLV